MNLRGIVMGNTTFQNNSFILSEAPSVRSNCIICDKPVKHSLSETDQAVILEIGYEPKTIFFHPGGRCFEQVDRAYLHVCPQAETQTANSIRGANIGQLALL